MINVLTSQAPIAETELTLHVADFLISPALVIGGVLLWRREALGYVTGFGLFFQASLLFIGLIIFLLIRPFLTAAPFVLVDVVVRKLLRPTRFGLGAQHPREEATCLIAA
jgi:hypothetical protein